MSDELKRCPCGCFPEMVIDSEWNAYALCMRCGRKGPKVPPPTNGAVESHYDDAVWAWNMEVTSNER